MLEVKPGVDGKGKQLVSTTAIKKGKVFHVITNYEVVTSPTFTSIQINQTTHIEEYYISYLNHSCEPNVIVDTTRLVFIAAKDIQPGQELSFFYPSTEWDMSTPFRCLCHAPTCLGFVAGARYVSLDMLGKQFTNHHVGLMALECLIWSRSTKTKPSRKTSRPSSRLEQFHRQPASAAI